MSFNKNGIVDFETLDEMAPYYYMKTKILDDGSVWGRINWLDISSNTTCFANEAEVNECLNQSNRFSLMGKVDYFRAANVLPNDYKKLDYIQSNGTQWIDTGYYWKHENVKIEMNALITSNSASQSLFGNEEPRSGGRYFAIVPHGSNGNFAFYTGETGSVGSASVTVNKRFRMECTTTTAKLLTVKIDNITKFTATYPGTIMTYANTTSTSANKGKVYIFTNHNSSNSTHTSQRIGGMRLYSFKMWDNDVMVRNFIPCKNASGTVGLWDTITQTFFTTPTGAFTAGTELNDLSIPQSGNFEFMLTYPKKSDIMYNRWRQTISPNADHVTSTTGTGYETIHTDFTNYAGPITRVVSGYTTSTKYVCNLTTNWWAPIGQYIVHQGGIPAADGVIQKETELWVRLDNLHPETMKLITSSDFYISGEDSDIARIVEEIELHSAHFIEN